MNPVGDRPVEVRRTDLTADFRNLAPVEMREQVGKDLILACAAVPLPRCTPTPYPRDDQSLDGVTFKSAADHVNNRWYDTGETRKTTPLANSSVTSVSGVRPERTIASFDPGFGEQIRTESTPRKAAPARLRKLGIACHPSLPAHMHVRVGEMPSLAADQWSKGPWLPIPAESDR